MVADRTQETGDRMYVVAVQEFNDQEARKRQHSGTRGKWDKRQRVGVDMVGQEQEGEDEMESAHRAFRLRMAKVG